MSEAAAQAQAALAEHGERGAVGQLVRAITAAVRAGDDAEVARLDAVLQAVELATEARARALEAAAPVR